ncbi:MAG: lysylphosphatidylglycerol synthase transmembrane domain-containing protein [Polyangiaceae bacterium]
MAGLTQPQPGFLRRNVNKLIASAIITACLLWGLHKSGLKMLPDKSNFAGINWWCVPGYALTLVVVHYFRAVRWRYLLAGIATVPRKRLITVSWVSFAAILLMPFRLGEFVRPLLIRQKGKLTMSAATGTVVVERVVDGLYLSLILAIALFLVPTVHPLPEKVVGLDISVAQVRGYGYFMLLAFSGVFITIGVYYFARKWAHKMTLLVFGVVSKPLGEKLASIAESLADGLHIFSRGGDAWGFFLETTAYWLMNLLGMWLLAWGCHITHADGSGIGFGEACALMGMLGITIVLPGPPGMLGVFQAGIYCGMAMYFPTSIITGPGAAYVFLLYVTQVTFQICAALFAMAIDPAAVRRLRDHEIDPPQDPKNQQTSENLAASDA